MYGKLYFKTVCKSPKQWYFISLRLVQSRAAVKKETEIFAFEDQQDPKNCLKKTQGSESSKNEISIKNFEDIPGPKGLPYFGSYLRYKFGKYSDHSIYHESLKEHRKNYGDIFKETIAGYTKVHLMNPEYYRQVFGLEGSRPFIPPLLQTLKKYRSEKAMSPGIGNTNGKEWYKLRNGVQKLLMRPKEVATFLDDSEQISTKFVDLIPQLRDKNGKIEKFRNHLGRWNLETSAMTCFDKRLNCLHAAELDSVWQTIIDNNDKLFKLSRDLNFALPFYKMFSTPTWKKLLAVEDFIDKLSHDLTDEAIAGVKKLIDKEDLGNRYGFMAYLLSQNDLNYKDVIVISLSLFGDGLSTIVPTTLGQLYCIATNPYKQELIREEILKYCPPNEKITVEMINKLQYLKAAVKEGFRLFPVGPEVSRLPQQDLVIGGYRIPAGTHIELNNFALLRDPQYFANPEKFEPERWLRDGSGKDVHPFLLSPFGHGPRMCLGRRFAEQSMFTLIIRLLQKYELHWVGDELNLSYQMLFIPNKDCTFLFKDH